MSEDQTTESQTTDTVESTEGQEQQQTAYTPNYSYKFMGEEREIDPDFRTIMTDAEKERKVREMVERSEALPLYKTRYGELEGKYKDIEGKYNTREQQMQKLGTLYQNKDYEGFFKHLGVPEDVLLQHAVNRIKFRDLPEDQKRLYNENQARAERESQLEEQLGESNQRLEQEAVLARTFQLDGELGKAEVSQTANQYDSIYGKGAFRSEVIKLGQYEALMNKRDLPAEEAVMAVMGKAKPIIERLGNQQPSQQNRPKVIPNIKGNSAAPGKKGFGSIADLRAASAKYGD